MGKTPLVSEGLNKRCPMRDVYRSGHMERRWSSCRPWPPCMKCVVVTDTPIRCNTRFLGTATTVGVCATWADVVKGRIRINNARASRVEGSLSTAGMRVTVAEVATWRGGDSHAVSEARLETYCGNGRPEEAAHALGCLRDAGGGVCSMYGCED